MVDDVCKLFISTLVWNWFSNSAKLIWIFYFYFCFCAIELSSYSIHSDTKNHCWNFSQLLQIFFSQWTWSVLCFKNETQNKDHLEVLIVLVIKWGSCQNLFILVSNDVNNILSKVINLGWFFFLNMYLKKKYFPD